MTILPSTKMQRLHCKETNLLEEMKELSKKRELLLDRYFESYDSSIECGVDELTKQIDEKDRQLRDMAIAIQEFCEDYL